MGRKGLSVVVVNKYQNSRKKAIFMRKICLCPYYPYNTNKKN